ncbi:MAG: TetR/AcrR family transcriptional regulator [Thermomicrobiales bacterium]
MRAIRQEGGRVNQKRRTRSELVATAITLLDQGKRPTIPELAEAAGVSRATAYRYFSSQEALLMEITLEVRATEVEERIARQPASDDAFERLEHLVESTVGVVLEHEAMFRIMLRASLEPKIDEHHVRKARRVRWIEEALEPIREKVSTPVLAHVIGGVVPYLGIEAVIALKDLYDLNSEEVMNQSKWACKALLRAALSNPEL